VAANILTPRLLDWWAARSRRSLRRRIASLRRGLVYHPDNLQLVVYAVRRLLLVLGLYGYFWIGLVVPPPLSSSSGIGSAAVSAAVHLSPMWKWVIWLVMVFVYTIPMQLAFSTYRYLRLFLFDSQEERQAFTEYLQQRLARLEEALQQHEAKHEAPSTEA